MRLSQDDHQSSNQPSGDDANLFDQTLFNPEEQLIGFLQQTARCHHSPPPAMPTGVTLLLLDRLLEHGLKPTISAGHRAAAALVAVGLPIVRPPPPARITSARRSMTPSLHSRPT